VGWQLADLDAFAMLGRGQTTDLRSRMLGVDGLFQALQLAPGDARASEGLDRLQQGGDFLADQLDALTAAAGSDGDLGAGGVVGPPLPPLPGDPAARPDFDPGRAGATAPR